MSRGAFQWQMSQEQAGALMAWMIDSRRVDELKAMLKAGADPQAPLPESASSGGDKLSGLLEMACELGEAASAIALLEAGAHPMGWGASDPRRSTRFRARGPAARAAMSAYTGKKSFEQGLGDSVAMACALIKAGARPEDPVGDQTLWQECLNAGCGPYYQTLIPWIEAGADIDEPTTESKGSVNLLSWAVKEGDAEAVADLLRLGADPMSRRGGMPSCPYDLALQLEELALVKGAREPVAQTLRSWLEKRELRESVSQGASAAKKRGPL